MKEYCALQTVQGCERNEAAIKKIHKVVSHIVSISCHKGTREKYDESSFHGSRCVSSVETASPDPEELEGLRALFSRDRGAS